MRRLLFIICVFFLSVTAVMAQKEKVKNQPYADLKWFHLGFHVGLHAQDLILTNTGVATNGETWYAEIPSYSPGFSVGVIGDMYLNPYFNLRFTPTIHFGDKKFVFRRPEMEGVEGTDEKDRSDLTDPELIKYPNSLSKATSRMVTLTFNFE